MHRSLGDLESMRFAPFPPSEARTLRQSSVNLHGRLKPWDLLESVVSQSFACLDNAIFAPNRRTTFACHCPICRRTTSARGTGTLSRSKRPENLGLVFKYTQFPSARAMLQPALPRPKFKGSDCSRTFVGKEQCMNVDED